MTAALIERPTTTSSACPSWCSKHDVNNCGEVFHESDLYVRVRDDFESDGLLVDVCQNDWADGTSTGPVVCVMWSKYGRIPVDGHIALAPDAGCELGTAILQAAAADQPIEPFTTVASYDPRHSIGVRWALIDDEPIAVAYVEIVYDEDLDEPVVVHLDSYDATQLGNGLLRACTETAG